MNNSELPTTPALFKRNARFVSIQVQNCFFLRITSIEYKVSSQYLHRARKLLTRSASNCFTLPIRNFLDTV